jgi:LigXa C-terminal domain like
LRLRPDVGGNKKHNDYHIARGARRAFSYTGIKTFPLQDGAMTKDQCGPLIDCPREHLVSSDAAIIQVQHWLIGAAQALAS